MTPVSRFNHGIRSATSMTQVDVSTKMDMAVSTEFMGDSGNVNMVTCLFHSSKESADLFINPQRGNLIEQKASLMLFGCFVTKLGRGTEEKRWAGKELPLPLCEEL